MASTVTAFSACIVAMNTILSWVDRVKDFARQCQEMEQLVSDIQLMGRAHMLILKNWATFWRIEEHTQNPYLRELWGEPDWVDVTDLMSRISEKSRKFATDLDRRSKGVQAVLLNTTQSHWTLRERVKSWNADMKDFLQTLSEITATSYGLCHEEDIPAEKEKRHLVLDTALGHTCLQLLIEQRQFAEKLYWSVAGSAADMNSNATVFIRLDHGDENPRINLKTIEFQSHLYPMYDLILVSGAQLAHLIATGLYEGELEVTGSGGSFSNACQALQHCEETTIKIRDHGFFCARKAGHGERVEFPELRQAHAANPPPPNLLELRIAIGVDGYREAVRWLNLSVKIVESAFFLAGTSWMSNFRSYNIRCLPADKSSHAFCLAMGEASREQSLLDPDLIAQNLYRIGLLLIELLTGLRLHNVSGKPPAETFDFVKLEEEGSNPKSWDLPQVTKIMNENFGERCGQAIQHCLVDIRMECARLPNSLLQSDRERAAKKILWGYWCKVYEPLRECAKVRNWIQKNDGKFGK